jgi:hypothetical protein
MHGETVKFKGMLFIFGIIKKYWLFITVYYSPTNAQVIVFKTVLKYALK